VCLGVALVISFDARRDAMAKAGAFAYASPRLRRGMG
jgi:hypothetical protein